jgi:hypothetical protein
VRSLEDRRTGRSAGGSQLEPSACDQFQGTADRLAGDERLVALHIDDDVIVAIGIAARDLRHTIGSRGMILSGEDAFGPFGSQSCAHFVAVRGHDAAVDARQRRHAPPDLDGERGSAKQPERLSWESGRAQAGGNHRQNSHEAGKIRGADAKFTP